MVCGNCGQVNEETKFCTKCGAKLGEEGNVKSKKTAPGRILLKVTGILFVVFAVIGVIGGISTIALLPNMEKMGIEMPGGKEGMLFSFILNIVSSILYIIIGILGIRNAGIVEKAKLLLQLIIGFIVFTIIITIINSIIMKTAISPIALIGFILPILFLIGAYKNHKAKGEK